MSWSKDYRVYDALSKGIKMEDIKPPLNEHEKRIYTKNKEIADEMLEMGIVPSFCMPSEG